MRETHRIKQSRYTDSDVLALYMKYREKKIGPFFQEVGDFIAHEKRTRGPTLEATAFLFSQFAFFQMYQSTKKIPLNPYGPCEWWLKTYLLGKLWDSNKREVFKETGLSIKQARMEISGWFPSNDPYPTEIRCANLPVLFGLIQLFSRYIKSVDVFSVKKINYEISKVFQIEGIPQTEIPHFIVATAVLLAGRSCEIVPGFQAQLILSVDRPRTIELLDIPVPPGATFKYVRHVPDGSLSVSVKTLNHRSDGLVNLGFTLMNTEVDTENYFDRSLVKTDQYGNARLDLNLPLAFERSAYPMVYPVN